MSLRFCISVSKAYNIRSKTPKHKPAQHHSNQKQPSEGRTSKLRWGALAHPGRYHDSPALANFVPIPNEGQINFTPAYVHFNETACRLRHNSRDDELTLVGMGHEPHVPSRRGCGSSTLSEELQPCRPVTKDFVLWTYTELSMSSQKRSSVQTYIRRDFPGVIIFRDITEVASSICLNA
ncbi:hypothetical protein NHQ30_010933 [Ciborinia camelliae]|nr:hypothetical protein NHQ30_010933 [Ciborinia camelliae]